MRQNLWTGKPYTINFMQNPTSLKSIELFTAIKNLLEQNHILLLLSAFKNCLLITVANSLDFWTRNRPDNIPVFVYIQTEDTLMLLQKVILEKS